MFAKAIVVIQKECNNETSEHHRIDRRIEVCAGGWLPQRRVARIPDTLQGHTHEGRRQDSGHHLHSLGMRHRVGVQLDADLQGEGCGRPADKDRRPEKEAGADGGGPGSHRGKGEETSPEAQARKVGMGGGERTKCRILNPETFFSSNGARYKRIRLRPRGKPSPQIYAYKVEILQELENLYHGGFINLFYGDESHLCTSGYVPYAWHLKGEDVFIPAQKGTRISMFGMTSRDNEYHGFETVGTINAQMVVDFLDDYSKTIEKMTFVVLDNASIHRSKAFKERIGDWQKRGLFIFYLPPYSPHLNIAETLWRIMKGKWIYPEDYTDGQTLISAAKRVVKGIGTDYVINHRKRA